MAALSLVAIMGCIALAVDVGRAVFAAQRSQDTADAAALAAGPLLTSQDLATASALTTVGVNNVGAGEFAVTCVNSPSGPSDIAYYAPGSTVPGYGPLGPGAWAMRVTCHVLLPPSFGAVVGLQTQDIARRATVLYGPTGGAPIMPMWIDIASPYEAYDVIQNLLMADGPHYPSIPGNFGWLRVPAGCSASWAEVMAGAPLSESDRAALWTEADDILDGLPGLKTGQWTKALEDRMALADASWSGETWDNFSPDNPRLLVIPLVTYVGGSGSNATFQVHKFGAFWLEGVRKQGSNKGVDGRFIRHTLPGGGVEPLAPASGLCAFQLVQ